MQPYGESRDNDNPYASPLTDARLSGDAFPSRDGNLLGPPTQARQWVIVFAVTLAVITYIDRVCISQAAPVMQRELRLSDKQMALVFSAFTFAYAAFESPGGHPGRARTILSRYRITVEA